MGRQNDVLLDYFDDNERFADLCNATLFDGLQVIDPAKLEDASEGRSSRGDITYSSRCRDVKKTAEGRRNDPDHGGRGAG